jgi:nucleotide-binding universal stress UspA family protein
MTWLYIVIIAGVILGTVASWAVFAYIAVRGLKTEIPDATFGSLLRAEAVDQLKVVKVLLPIDGSAASIAAVQEVAHCPLPQGSTIRLLYAVHSRLPVIPDFPPWAVTIAAAHGESIREQTRHSSEVLTAAARYLQAYQPNATVEMKTVEGVPKDEILREAAALGADRIVMGSHGRGRGQRVVLGSTVAAVSAEAPCTVHISRLRGVADQSVGGAHAA